MMLKVLLLSVHFVMTTTEGPPEECECSVPAPTITTSGTLAEGNWVMVTCSAMGPVSHPPPNLTWNLQQDPQQRAKRRTGGTFRTSIHARILLSDQHDGFKIICTATDKKRVKAKAQTTLKLDVLYPPKDTEIQISPTVPVSVGETVNLTCLCDRANPPTQSFGWMKISYPSRPEVIERTSQVYSFRVSSGDRGRVFYCGCSNPQGTQASTGRLLTFKGDEHSGKKVDVYVTLKTLGILMLISALITFQSWFRCKMATQNALQEHFIPQDVIMVNYVNTEGDAVTS